ncbi:hypothetical protein [Rosistilla oblonga]|uniref:hypothetical protein n=1 Tax=Rosistilla oblonga TaxID=2527990 RepID=UPI0011A9B82E|nr:hypothetical protein [Rosistilla oblonga]
MIDQAAGHAEDLADFVAGFSRTLWKIFHRVLFLTGKHPLLRPLVVKIASTLLANASNRQKYGRYSWDLVDVFFSPGWASISLQNAS